MLPGISVNRVLIDCHVGAEEGGLSSREVIEISINLCGNAIMSALLRAEETSRRRLEGN